jgi:hypothetical protein
LADWTTFETEAWFESVSRATDRLHLGDLDFAYRAKVAGLITLRIDRPLALPTKEQWR